MSRCRRDPVEGNSSAVHTRHLPPNAEAAGDGGNHSTGEQDPVLVPERCRWGGDHRLLNRDVSFWLLHGHFYATYKCSFETSATMSGMMHEILNQQISVLHIL